ncbi:DUF3293 domain-containing protein [Paraburkholderia sp. C35]|uniref:DUF3293 domain-containing protein n=1 Tax=Paraburkholderia sp. C35 TaxID=2126993 RepID=UPI000D692E45|nr:DUF3293 domain-containing protein [Paraburkholderia sp. C35]
MFSDSAIPRETIQAYLETHYQVHGSTPTWLEIGQYNTTLAALHAAHRVTSSAFITACNPFSEPLDASSNAHRQKALAEDIGQLGARSIDGIGQHPSNAWPGEPSFLVLGLSLDKAKALGVKHGQNAIVFCGEDAVPRLILLR